MKRQAPSTNYRTLLGLAFIAGAASPAAAQWTVTNLHPAGAGGSYLYACGAGQQGGMATVGNERSFLWRDSAVSAVDLSNASGIGSSRVNGIGDGWQVGRAFVNGVHRAGMWHSNNVFVDLNPTNPANQAVATESEVYATSGGEQVGRCRFFGGVADHASLWSGSAASWINLSPPSSTASAAYGVHNGMQVGYAIIAGAAKAVTWHGNVGSMQNIHPTGAYGSVAWAVHEGKIVGTVSLGGIIRASVWSSSVEPWVDLNPPNSTESKAQAIFNGVEAGYVRINNVNRASVWQGTQASWEDLSQYLPGTWSHTYATGVWNDLNSIFVTGYGLNAATNRYEALLWTKSAAAACYANCDGSTAPPALNANDFQCFLNAFAAGNTAANCDSSTANPILNANDFQCFLNKFAAGCT